MEEETLDEFESSQEEQESDTDLEEVSKADEDVEDSELVKAKELANNYKIRAEKAEAKLKNKAPAKESSPKKVQEQQTLSRDEAILFAKGLEEADVDDAKFIADRKGINLVEATLTPEFKSLKRERDAERKAELSSLPASRGSKTQEKKTLATKGLSTEDHKRLWADKVGL